MLSPEQQRAIAEQLLGCQLDAAGYAPCPGAHRHTTGSGKRDFRLFFESGRMPREHCFHASCLGERTEFMRRLHHAIHQAERGDAPSARPRYGMGERAPQPPPQRPSLSMELAERVAGRCPVDVTEAMLIAASPIPIPANPTEWPALLIDTLYRPGERVLLFTNSRSQGQYLRVAGEDTYTLSSRPGVRATPHATLPLTAPQGAWFLCAPVRGDWQPNPRNTDPATGQPRLGRRHGECCTRYPYAVLESDTIAPATWLKILAQLHDPVAAVYTSGGKSIHALIRVDCPTAEAFNARRRELIARLVPVGADPAAITPVRLTRLPGIIRAEKTAPQNLQRLLYLNPYARQGSSPIINRLHH